MRRLKAGLAVTFCTFALAAGQPVWSQPAPQASRPLNLTRDERNALVTLQATVASPDRRLQDNALAAAQAAVRGTDARYAVASLAFQIARARGDVAGMATAADAMLGTGVPQGAELAALLANQATRAYTANDTRRADALIGRMVESQPNNPVILADAGQFKARLGDRAAAVALFQRAIAAQRAAGGQAPESWYQRALALAVDGRLAAPSAMLGRELVAAYPTPANWRDALLALRLGFEPPPPPGRPTAGMPVLTDATLDLDIRRLARAAGGLAGERDYLEFSQALVRTSLAAEAKAVLDEGVGRNMLDAAEPVVRQQLTAVTARAAQERAGLAAARTRALAAATGSAALAAGDSHFGAGQYAAAAELYQAALQKGGEDPGLVNLRLGAALALAGQRGPAEAAFRAVTGTRAALASYWLVWLSRAPSA